MFWDQVVERSAQGESSRKIRVGNKGTPKRHRIGFAAREHLFRSYLGKTIVSDKDPFK